MRFLTYGSTNIDLIFTVDHILEGGETLQSSNLVKSAGGKGANQSTALAKAGAEVYHAGKIGEDGAFLLDLLCSWGVDTRYVRSYDGATGQALIQVDRNGQNAIILYGGGNKAITIEEIEETLDDFGDGDMLVLQNEIVHTAHLITSAKERGMRVCMNIAPFDPSVFDLPLDLLDLLVVNEIEGAALAEMEGGSPFEAILDRLVARYPTTEILLTVGADGSYYGFASNRIHQPIIEAEVVDTTAAGDTYIGYYLAAIGRGYSPKEAMYRATKASAITVSQSGAMASIPYAQEVFD
ncbi:MAG: ribokinase [Sphaerochaeta sp.]|jgi:ribokinase|nr:ribokinase [Sphaerochaeta sp.]MDX9915700.1 ribokinase [Sphaerochaeta sp.]